LQNARYFSIEESARRVIAQYESEAKERHIEIDLRFVVMAGDFMGTRRQMETAIAQYLINAIKYANGSSTVNVRLEIKDKSLDLSITDMGIPVQPDEPVWEFGYRGSAALEYHVNGSGIGLSTVAKIVAAHAGSYYFRISPSDNRVVTFGFIVPIDNALGKISLLTKGT